MAGQLGGIGLIIGHSKYNQSISDPETFAIRHLNMAVAFRLLDYCATFCHSLSTPINTNCIENYIHNYGAGLSALGPHRWAGGRPYLANRWRGLKAELVPHPNVDIRRK